MSTTVLQIASAIPTLDQDGRFDISAAQGKKKVPSVVEGLKPRRPPTAEGLYEFAPEELLTIHVPTVEVNGRVIGFQRPFIREHARKIANAMRGGYPIPEIQVAVDGNGVFTAVDGQHRAVGAVIAGLPLHGVVRRMSKEEQRRLFAGQRKARAVNPNVLVLAGDSPFDRYVQEAVATDNHPWGRIVSANPSSKTRISPFSMLQLLYMYVGNTASWSPGAHGDARWDRPLADEMAPLISCFGDKQSNPAAFRPAALRAVGQTAMRVLRRNEERRAEDYQRWQDHMPGFRWERFRYLRTTVDFAEVLVRHWNKGLAGRRRVNAA